MRRITDVRLPQPINTDSQANRWWVLLDDKDIVLSIEQMIPGTAISGENWKGDWLSPMGLDLQINGGMGLAFTELTFKELPKLFELLDRLWTDGIQAICPTFVSCDVANLREALFVLQEARKESSPNRCELLGAHLEGPFISAGSCGAHPLSNLCAPSLVALDERIKGFEDEIALVTLAPELNGSSELINKLRRLGVVVSLGHSAADADTTSLSFDQGISMLTHTFNAMPGLGHREPGPVGKAIEHGEIALGLIADGVHVNPTIVVLLHRLASHQLVLVSDVLAPYGLDVEKYHWDDRLLLVDQQGTCRLENGTFAGSTIPLLEGCIKLAKWTGDPSAAIWAATIAPRRVLGNRKAFHENCVGKSLDELLRWKFNSAENDLSWQRAA